MSVAQWMHLPSRMSYGRGSFSQLLALARSHTDDLRLDFFAGTLVSDFYAAYHDLDCATPRCLVHLLRELVELREELPWQSVRALIQPLIDPFRDAIQSGKDREALGHAKFPEAYM